MPKSAAEMAQRETGEDPRVTRSRAAVLDAAMALLAEEGYAAFTVEAVFARTGVAKTTIYRHWPTRNDLLVAVIEQLGRRFDLPDTGAIRGDLIEFFSVSAPRMEHDKRYQSIKSVPGLIEAARCDPTVAAWSRRSMDNFLGCLRAVLERGRARGEVRRDRDLDAMANILLGSIVIRRAFLEQDASDAYIAEAVDTVLEGIAAGARRRPRARLVTPEAGA